MKDKDKNKDDFDIPQEARKFLTGLSKKAPSGSESDRIITGKVPRRPVGCATNFEKRIKEISMKFHNH